MRAKYFHLFANCVPVRGALRSTICDLQRDNYELIPNDLFDILTLHAGRPVDDIKAAYAHAFDPEIDEYFDWLADKELGFYTNSLQGFPPLHTGYYEPRQVTNAIVDFDAHSHHDLKEIVRKLSLHLCEALELRFFHCVSLSTLETILSDALADCSMRSIEILIGDDNHSYTWEGLASFLHSFKRVKKITIHSSDKDQFRRHDQALVLFTSEKISSEQCCGLVSPYYFISNMELFVESLHHNSCLNRKISVDRTGAIKNCPSMKNDYGDISSVSLDEVLNKPEFRAVWDISKDQINICRDCEFRYICQDCRAYTADAGHNYAKPLKCNYDPYEAKWS